MALTAKKVYAILKRQISDMEAKLNSPVRYRGTVATADLLPLNPNIGDMYNIESKSVYGEAGMNVAWNGVVWDTMGAPIDMSLYLTKEEAETVIQRLVTEYFEKNPVKPGATTEQAQQIEQNKTNIASLKEDIDNLSSSKISKFYASSQGETHLADSDNGKIMDMMVYGKSEQKKYQGYQLLEHNTSEYNFTATTSYYGLVNNASENIKSGAYYLRKLGNTPTVLITFLDASKKMVKQEYLTDGSEKRIVFETDVAYVKYIIQNLTAGTDYKGTVKLILASTSGADYEPYYVTEIMAESQIEFYLANGIDSKTNPYTPIVSDYYYTTIYNSFRCYKGEATLDELTSKSTKLLDVSQNTNAYNLLLMIDGTVTRSASSSKRYKDIGESIIPSEIEEWYKIEPVWAKYKDGYLAEGDENEGRYLPMFIAEDVEEHFPQAVTHMNGQVEDWNYRMMIPAMFAMIKQQKEEIESLKQAVKEMRGE